MKQFRDHQIYENKKINSILHESDDIEFIGKFIDNFTYVSSIDINDMKKIILNDKLIQTPFKITKITNEEIM